MTFYKQKQYNYYSSRERPNIGDFVVYRDFEDVGIIVELKSNAMLHSPEFRALWIFKEDDSYRFYFNDTCFKFIR